MGKFYLLFLLTLFCFGGSIYGLDKSKSIFYEIENLSISGKYYKVEDKNIRCIKVKHKNNVSISFKSEKKEGILWIKGVFENINNIEMKVNNHNVSLDKKTFYFKWVRLGLFDLSNDINIEIKNKGSDIKIDKIGIVDEGLKPYDTEYAIDDIEASYIYKGVRIDFSGADFSYGNEVVLYRKMTTESYIKYMKQKLGILTDNELLSRFGKTLIDFSMEPFKKVGYVEIDSRDRYSIIDILPVDGYQCEYYLKVENDFGKSIESKRVVVEYRESDKKIIVANDTKTLVKSFGYKNNNNKFEFTNGFVEKSDINSYLYINGSDRLKNIPEFLSDSYYFRDVKNGEFVKFHTNKATDVYIYSPDIINCNSDYYYNKGFNLVKIPLGISDSSDKDMSFFFHKRYRKGQGDALYIKNKDNVYNTGVSGFSVVVEKDDIVIYYDMSKGFLKESTNIVVKGIDKNDNKEIFAEEMDKTGESLFVYRIEYGASLYQGKKIFFEFSNENNTVDVNNGFLWDFYDYLKKSDKLVSNVVFFKEFDETLVDIDFGGVMTNYSYRELEDYYVEDGSVYHKKSDRFYGFNKEMTPKQREYHCNNVLGYVDENHLVIEYDNIDKKLDENQNISLDYRFDDNPLVEKVFVEKIRDDFYRAVLNNPSIYSNIRFHFSDDNTRDIVNGKEWSWNFNSQKTYNAVYERALLKRNYINLPPTDEIQWEIALDNGIYKTVLVVEKNEEAGINSLDINGKSYRILDEYDGIIEIRDNILVSRGKMLLKNNGSYPIRIYGIYIDCDKKHITDRLLPVANYCLKDLNKSMIEDEVLGFNNDEIYELTFNISKMGDEKKKYEITFNGSGIEKNLIYISSSKDFENKELIGVVRVDKNFKGYTCDITEYINKMSSGENVFKIYVKGDKSVRLGGDKNELNNFGINVLTYVDENFQPYKCKGYILLNDGKYTFKEASSDAVYDCYSYGYDLDKYKDQLVVVTGYVKEDVLNIVKIFSSLDITKITGDTYSNKINFEWFIYSNNSFDGLRYRIKNLFKLKEVTGNKIVEKIVNDGEYVLEVIPIKNSVAGLSDSLRFIVDRTGPSVLGFEKLTDYTPTNEQKLPVIYSDNYTKKENIKFYKEINGFKEEIFVKDDNLTFTLNEGKQTVKLYAVDELGNIGSVFEKEVVIDNTKPFLDFDVINTQKSENNIKDRVIIGTFYKNDNLTEEDKLITYYCINNGEWKNTNERIISFDINNYSDGVYPISAYLIDKAGIKSDVITKSFVVDTKPLEKIDYYKVSLNNNIVNLEWQSKNSDKTFSSYKIKRSPKFSFTFNEDYLLLNENIFKDNIFTSYEKVKYYISVIDIYGNESEEVICYASNDKEMVGNAGDLKTITFEDSNLTIKMENNKPLRIGLIKDKTPINENVKSEYNLINNKIYVFTPEGKTFNEPISWEVDLGDLTGDIAKRKQSLTVYYYNPIRNLWEEVESVYNSTTDKLKAKLFHFSKYGVGERTNNKVSIGNMNNNISPSDGSLNSTLLLCDLASHQDSFDLKLDFNTQKFDQISKLLMPESVKNFIPNEIPVNDAREKILPYIYENFKDFLPYYEESGEYYKINGIVSNLSLEEKRKIISSLNGVGYNSFIIDYSFVTKFNVDPVNTEKERRLNLFRYTNSNERWKDYFDIYGTPDDGDKNYHIIRNGEVFNYNNHPQKYNMVDNAWDINIPKLISYNPSVKNYKYIRFEDGTVTEIRLVAGAFKNTIGKRFILKTLPDNKGYLVKGELYKNYKFDQNGLLEYIFYSNDQENVINRVDLKNNIYDKSISLSVKYDENENIMEIYSHKKDGDISNKVVFNYSYVPGTLYYSCVKRLKNIEKFTKVNNDYKKNLSIDIKYESFNPFSWFNPSIKDVEKCYLVVYNQSSTRNKDNTAIEYERLKKIDYNFYKYNGDSINTKSVEVSYSFDENQNNSIKLVNFDEKSFIHNDSSISFPCNFDYIYKYSNLFYMKKVINLTLNFTQKYFYSNVIRDNRVLSVKLLNKVIITDNEKEESFNFNNYSVVKNWLVIGNSHVNYCVDKTLVTNEKTETIENYFIYKKNYKPGLVPFYKNIKIFAPNYYEITNRENNKNIGSRDFKINTTKFTNYSFEESVLDNTFGSTEKRYGMFKFKGNNDVGSLRNGFFEGSKNLEDFVEDLSYKKESAVITNYQLGSLTKSIKPKDKDGEIVLQKEVFEYIDNKISKKIDYINSNEKKVTEYEYRKLIEYYGLIRPDEEFLFTQIYKIKEQVDKNVYKIHENKFQKSQYTNAAIPGESYDYLSDIIENKYTKKYVFNEYDRLESETEIVRDNDPSIKGKKTSYIYDSLNRVAEVKVSGKSNILNNSNIMEGTIGNIEKKYYDDFSGLVITTEKYTENDIKNKIVTLNFYDKDEKEYKTVTLLYNNNVAETKCLVLYGYSNEYLDGIQLYVSGNFSLEETSDGYIGYYEKIKTNDVGKYAFIDTSLDNYNTIISDLKTKKFDYQSSEIKWGTGNEFMGAEQTFHLLSYTLLKESYGKNKVRKYESYKKDSFLRVYDKKEYKYDKNDKSIYGTTTITYDEFGNVTSETHPTYGLLTLPVTTYTTEYVNYGKIITIKKGDIIETQKYNNYDCMISKTITGKKMVDSKEVVEMENEELNYYNLAGQLTKRINADNTIEEYTYNYYGLVKSILRNTTDPNSIITSYNVYNKIGKSIYGYTKNIINKADFKEKDHWISRDDYDDFGNKIKIESKFDNGILTADEQIKIGSNNLIKDIVYNGYGKVILERGNLHKVMTPNNTNDDILDDVVYEYTYFGAISKKISYQLDVSKTPESIFVFTESYTYDNKKRLIEKNIKRNTKDMTDYMTLYRMLISEYDDYNRVKVAFVYEKGKNWIKTENEYDYYGNVIHITNYVLKSMANPEVLLDTLKVINLTDASKYELKQDQYNLYDDFQRKIASVDFDLKSKYIVYDNNGMIIAEYTTNNFSYSISTDNKLNIDSTSTNLIEYTYNLLGQKIKEKSNDYEKRYNYNKKGRLVSESINRFVDKEQTIQKNKYYYYDSLGRVYKTVNDDVIEEITKWEYKDSDNKQEIKITITDGYNTKNFTNEITYTSYGNVLSTKDKDGYTYEKKYNMSGGVITDVKKKDSLVISKTENIYNSTQDIINSVLTTSNMVTNLYNNELKFYYNENRQVTRIENNDYKNDILVKTLVYSKDIGYDSEGRVNSIKYNNDDTVTYGYNDAGMLNSIKYPDNTIYNITYNKTGSMHSSNISSTIDIIKSIEYLSKSSIIKSYVNGANITTGYILDNMNRVKTKSFSDTDIVYLQQTYNYDRSGNIKSIEESSSYPDSSIIEIYDRIKTFQRTFTYDKYNRLIDAEYTGAVECKVDMSLTHIENDYYTNIKTKLTNNSLASVDIESKASSVVISSEVLKDLDLKPDKIRIYKQSNSHLSEDMINLWCYNTYDTEFKRLEVNKFNIVENIAKGYIDISFVRSNVDVDRMINAIKINFELDNMDINTGPTGNTNKKTLKDIVEFISRVDKTKVSYSYDIMGNRISNTDKMIRVNSNGKENILDKTENTYKYDDNSRLLLSDNDYTYSYNDNGSLIEKRKKNNLLYWSYLWDSRGYLREVIKYENSVETYREKYYYDEGEKRVKTETVEYTETYIYEGLNLIYQKKKYTDNTVKKKKLYYALNTLQAVIDDEVSNGAIIYQYQDILNSTRFTTNTDKTILSQNITKPFGEELYRPDKTQHFQYATHNGMNEKTGLTYMIGRFMDNATGRFISADTQKDGINYYVYAHNNPTTRIDPDGHIAPLIIAAIIGISVLICAAIGGTAGAIIGGVAAWKGYENAMRNRQKDTLPKYNLVGAMFAGIILGSLIGSAVGAVFGVAIGTSIVGVGSGGPGAIVALVSLVISTAAFVYTIMDMVDVFCGGLDDNGRLTRNIFGVIASLGTAFAGKDVKKATGFMNQILGGNINKMSFDITVGAKIDLDLNYGNRKETFSETTSSKVSALSSQTTSFVFKSQDQIVMENLLNHGGSFQSDTKGYYIQREIIEAQSNQGDDGFGFIDPGMIGNEFGSDGKTLIIDLDDAGQKNVIGELGYLFGLESLLDNKEYPRKHNNPNVITMYSNSNNNDLRRILSIANSDETIKYIILTGAHGFPNDARIGTYVFGEKLNMQMREDIHFFVLTCYQGKFEDRWANGLGLPLKNIHAVPDTVHADMARPFLNNIYYNNMHPFDAWSSFLDAYEKYHNK